MSQAREKVVVAMSGGVDSSVAACLLVEQGYEVVGLFMRTGVGGRDEGTEGAAAGTNGQTDEGTKAGSSYKLRVTSYETPPHSAFIIQHSSFAATAARRPHQGCCSATDAADARFVAGMLGIPFYALNFEAEFDRLIDYFADEYARGRTPNPCVVCNHDIKFGRIVEYADAVGAHYIATGHYARIGEYRGRRALLRAVDAAKDQSYVLFGLDRHILDRVIFPIGHLTKPEVRRIAERYNLPNRHKPDSVEICFAPDRDYARVVRQRRPDAFREGDVVDARGHVVGRHHGVANYTVGQRRGLGIALGEPAYVTGLNVETNTVTLGAADDLLCDSLVADRVNFLVDPPEAPFRAEVKIRYLHRAAEARVEPLVPQVLLAHATGSIDNRHSTIGNPDSDRPTWVRVTFDEPQRAITPGQAAVFYDGAAVIGGGWIESAAAIGERRMTNEE